MKVARVTVMAMNHGLMAARGAGNTKDAGTAMDSLMSDSVNWMFYETVRSHL